jgi:hypothetical protein
MRKILWLIPVVWLVVLAFCFNAEANPFVVCDPQLGVTHYKVAGATWVPASVPAQSDGSLKMDVATAPNGTSNLTFRACINDPVWGELCSVTAPFSFTRPGTPNTPAGVKLAP